MNTNDNRLNAHNEINHIFKDLLPTRNMAERPEQVALCHRMLEAMLDGGIALCDAGTGIGKTYAYLVAGTVYSRFRAASGLEPKPILISTSSIALQSAVLGEYLPLLSGLLLEDGVIAKPLQAVIRKGKSHYVCEERLERRLDQLDLRKKNWKAGAALLTLRGQLDMSEAAHLSHYDRERVCVPRICDCQRETCRYFSFLEDCNSEKYLFQICNHNLLLADAIHRGSGRRPILPDACALIVDEAHKLPETARQMFGVTLAAEDIRALTHSLQGERFLLAAEVLSDSAKSLLRKLNRPPEGKPFDYYRRSLAAPERSLTVIHRQLHGLLTPATRRRLDSVSSAVSLFHQGHPDMVFYIEEDTHGGTMLCATISDLTAQLRQTLWRQDRPAILTSATLAVGEDFRRFKEETGLLTDSRVTESVTRSPFDYQRNCLLYLPKIPPRQKAAAYYDELAKEIAALLDTAQGHALALFTSYAAMSAVKERLPNHGLRYPLFTMGRSTIHTTEQFKASPGSVLLAAGAAWEGFDFPGDCVSLLIIPRLPFAAPDALKEKEREKCPMGRIPETEIYAAFVRMYNKLKRHEGVILKPVLAQLRDLNDALQRGNPAMLTVNRAIAEESERSYNVNVLQAKGLLDAAACSAKLLDIEAKLTELRRERRRLLKNEDIEEVMDTLRQTANLIHSGPERLEWFDEVLFADLVEKITAESMTRLRFRLYGGIELTEQIREVRR